MPITKMSISGKIGLLTFIVSIFIACHPTKHIANDELIEYHTFDTLEIADLETGSVIEKNYELPVYHGTKKREWDLIHTKLEVSFDWDKQQLHGKAELRLKPMFYDKNELILDAKVFDIHTIKNATTGQAFKYEYDDFKLKIILDKSYSKEEELSCIIDYTAKPNEGPIGGSAAITSDKGLYFINPLGEDTDKPKQIWTQGETEASSRWFPTIDSPNERCTQEIYITVQEKYATLSNGLMKSSVKNNDGTRTDYWLMDQPHAPYLFMMTVGEFAKVDDTWNDMPLSYYVEPDYKPYAKEIFNHTPEMLSFFSKITGVNYPWQKYAQIIVRDYVSGAMENTTAVIFGEFVQKTSQELKENNNDMIVAHEMFHHWFGDYVTCESWSNITLNEGFANYGEYLWTEEKYGKKAADHHKADELVGYLSMMQRGGHDLINYGYDKKEDMFDAHSYNKGGIILHMLRNYLGDEAFFASLNKYLKDNAYTAVEADELRMAFEETTGEDLNWFFNQWFFDQGHPVLDITKSYYPEGKKYTITIDQIQDVNEAVAVYQLPIDLKFVYDDNRYEIREIWLNQRNQTFEFEGISSDIATVVIDYKDVLLLERLEDKTDKELFYEFVNNDNYYSKMLALRNVRDKEYLEKMFVMGISDQYDGIRTATLNTAHYIGPSVKGEIESLVATDNSSSVRRKSLEMLYEMDPVSGLKKAEEILNNEQAYSVIFEALSIIGNSNPALVLNKAESLQNVQATSIKTKISEIFGDHGNESHFDFFKKNILNASKFSVFPLYNDFQTLMFRLDAEKMIGNKDYLVSQAKNLNSNPIKRFLATKTISLIKEELKKKNVIKADKKLDTYISQLTDAIIDIKSHETNERIKMMYQGIQ